MLAVMHKTATFSVSAIDADVCAQLRVRDDAGNVPELLVDTEGGSPLRCCLSVSAPGEPVVLASYAPLRRWASDNGAKPGAYEEVGPVFLHAQPCAGPSSDGFPAAYRGSPRVLRAYNSNGRLVGGELLDGTDEPEPVIERLFADPDVALLHARAVVYGCFTFAIDRR